MKVTNLMATHPLFALAGDSVKTVGLELDSRYRASYDDSLQQSLLWNDEEFQKKLLILGSTSCSSVQTGSSSSTQGVGYDDYGPDFDDVSSK